MKIVILDKDTLGADIDLSPLGAVGECTVYGTTRPEEVAARVADAAVVVTNKLKLGEHNLAAAHHLRLICVAATGYDNIDTAYCRRRGIALCNVPGYSTEAVAQHTFALILALLNRVGEYNKTVLEGDWIKSQTI